MTAPIGEPPLDALPPDAPATVEDVRGSRRWTWVALAWAIAASAVAVLALIQANDAKNNNDSAQATTTQQDVTPQFDQFKRETNDRLDAFSRRLSGRAAAGDVQKLDKRLTKAENDASQAADDAQTAKDDASKQADTVNQMQQDIQDLQQRVDTLEKQQQQQGTTP